MKDKLMEKMEQNKAFVVVIILLVLLVLGLIVYIIYDKISDDDTSKATTEVTTEATEASSVDEPEEASDDVADQSEEADDKSSDDKSSDEEEDNSSVASSIFTNESDVENMKVDPTGANGMGLDTDSVTGGSDSEAPKTEEVPITDRNEAIRFGMVQVGKAKREDGHTIELKVIGNTHWQMGEWCHVKLPSFNEDSYMFISKCSFESSPDSEFINSLTLVDYPPSLGKPDKKQKEEENSEESSDTGSDTNNDSNSDSNSDSSNNDSSNNDSDNSSNTNSSTNN